MWEACDVGGDCSGSLVCYGIGTLPASGTGKSYKGFCTTACTMMNDTQCTTNPSSGTVKTTCNARGECELSCAGNKTCPTGMDCVNWGPSGSFCSLPAM